MKHLIVDTVHGIEALEALNATVAVEAFSLKAVANRAIDIIPNLSHAFSEVMASSKTDKYDLKPLNVNLTVLNRAIKSADYMSVGILNVYVPQGFQGNLLEYTVVLNQALNFSNIITERMVKFNQLISAFITDKNTRRSTKDLSLAASTMEQERQGVRDALAVFVKEGSRSDRASLKNVYASMGEISTVSFATLDIITKANETSIEQVQKLTNDASELLKALGDQAMAGQIPDMSAESYRSLSSATLTMARDVELHALLMYAVYQLKKAVEHTSEALIKALRY